MHAMKKAQQGVSAIALIVLLVVIGAIAYVGLQFIPQYMESGTVDAILTNVSETHDGSPFKDPAAVTKALEKQLNVNDMMDMKESFKVEENTDGLVVTVHYERDLNLLYETRVMPYDKQILLRR